MLRYLTAGESHGKELLAILEGMPAGLKINPGEIDRQLQRRQQGYGRGARMKLEKDRAEVVAGLRAGLTTGSPLAIIIKNRDFSLDRLPPLTRPTPGHADLAGGLKYGLKDLRDVRERASARETASRVAVGAITRIFLREFGVELFSHVVEIGGVGAYLSGLSSNEIKRRSNSSILRCADKEAESEMVNKIEEARRSGDSLGGVFEVVTSPVPPGLGSFVHYDRRLDYRLAGAIMSIPSVKAVEIGLGTGFSGVPGHLAHDEIFYAKRRGFYHRSNNAGGIEAGVTNGEPVVVRATIKPIPTIKKPLRSVDFRTKKTSLPAKERADVCVVPAAGVIGEAVVAFELARSMLEKFGGDSLGEIRRNYRGYLKQVKSA